MSVRILTGDCRAVLATLPKASVQCCVTSPPYFGLRDYGVNGQIGLEASPDAYVAELVGVFREVRRVMRDDGTLWLNLGDSYASNWPCNRRSLIGQGSLPSGKRADRPPRMGEGLKDKDLLGIPWAVAFALRADGWWLRSDIIWAKPNPMPESVTDRPTSAHEHVFLLSKRERYFYDADAVRQPIVREWDEANGGSWAHTDKQPIGSKAGHHSGAYPVPNPAGANLRNVWTIATQPFSGAHFATMPPDLAERCVKAGTSERGQCPACAAPWARVVDAERRPGSSPTRNDGMSRRSAGNGDRNDAEDERSHRVVTTTGWRPTCACPEHTPVPQTVLDPFAGAGTTGLVADRLGRNAVLIELNPAYAAMARDRIADDCPMFASVA